MPHGLEALANSWMSGGRRRAEAFPAARANIPALFDDGARAAYARRPPGRPPAPQDSGPARSASPQLSTASLLAGLDEKVWPPAVETDAFLNRPMRARARPFRAGTANRPDGARLRRARSARREAILSRAKKRGGEPTVASRFLQRIGAAAGDEAVAAAERRGEVYLAYARALDEPETAVSASHGPNRARRVELRPRSLSVTRVETLRRDPYALYARAHSEASADGADRARARGARSGRSLARRAAGFRGASSLRRAPADARSDPVRLRPPPASRCCSKTRPSRG